MLIPIRNEAEPERVPLRSYLECGVVARVVKGQDERPSDALDNPRHHFRKAVQCNLGNL